MPKTPEPVAEEIPEQETGPTPEQIQIALLTNQFRYIAGRHDEVLKRLADSLYANSPGAIANAKAFVEREVAAANAALQQIAQGG